MKNETLRTLEYEKILALLAAEAGSFLGKEAAAALLEKHAEKGLTPEQTELLFHGCETLRSLPLAFSLSLKHS